MPRHSRDPKALPRSSSMPRSCLRGEHAGATLVQGAELARSRDRRRDGGGDGQGRRRRRDLHFPLFDVPLRRQLCGGGAARHPDRFALVKPVDPDDPGVADVIGDWKKTPGTVGIRIMLTKEANRAPDAPGLARIRRAAARHDFPVNILFWGNVDAGTALIDRYPDTRFIIDHLAILQPRVPPAPPQPWADLPKVLELAKRPNAVIKVSGACTLSREPYPFPDIWDPLARVFDAWGFDRCLWGTDWTRAFAVVNYEQAVEPFRKTDRLSESERAMLMGGACAKAYVWSPQKG